MRKLLRLAAVTFAGLALTFTGTLAAHASTDFRRVPPPRHHCTTLVTFNLPHGSHVLTETQGPWLRVNEVAAYQGNTYTITSVTHTGFLGHDRFTVADVYGNTVTNFGPSIVHGEAHLLAC